MSALDLAAGFVREHEGLRLEAYRDGGGAWTIGYGHAGPHIGAGLQWTQEDADAALAADLRAAQASAARAISRALSDRQWAAVISLAFNVGAGALARSTLCGMINRGDDMAAAHEFPKWAQAGGRESRGLLIRRFEEAALFLKGS